MNRTSPNREKEGATVMGANLQTFRLEAGMSQKALGEELGVSKTQVGKYERGDDMLNGYKLYACAKVLGCSMEDFFQSYPKNQMPAEHARSVIMTSADERMLKEYRGLPSALQELARTNIRTWSRELSAKRSPAEAPPA